MGTGNSLNFEGGYRTPPASFTFDPRSPPTPVFLRTPNFADARPIYASPYTPRYALTFTPPRRGAGSMPMRGADSPIPVDPLIDSFGRLSLNEPHPVSYGVNIPKFLMEKTAEEPQTFPETHLVVAALDRKQRYIFHTK